MPQMISAKEAATVIGSSTSLVKKLIEKNVLHAQKVGSVYLISREEVDSKLPLIREKFKFGWHHHAGRGQYLALREEWGLKVTKKQKTNARYAQKKYNKANGSEPTFPLPEPVDATEEVREALAANTEELRELREVIAAFLFWCRENWSVTPAKGLQ